MNPEDPSMTTIEPARWARDHWSTLAYAFTCLGAGGRLDARRMRRDGDRYPTRLRGGVEIKGHTDYDCLVDIEAVGVLVNKGSALDPLIVFTPEGLKLGQWLCRAMDTNQISTAKLLWEDALAASGASL